MMKRFAIAGSRNFDNYEKLKSEMDLILRFYDIENEITIVSGGVEAPMLWVSAMPESTEFRSK